MTSRPAPLSKAPDPRDWAARRRGGPSPEDVEGLSFDLAFADLSAAADALFSVEAETPRLSVEDEERIAKTADASARNERRAAHIALRILLERALGSSIRRTPYRIAPGGKPVLVGPAGDPAPIHFSLSHTRGHALIGVASHPIGVDLEQHRVPRIMGERRAAIERAGITLAGGAPLPAHDRDARFLTAWVRLEAMAKADGQGVGAHLSVILGRRSEASVSGGGSAPRGLVARDLAAPPGLYAAVACPGGLKVPECLRFPADREGILALLQENAR